MISKVREARYKNIEYSIRNEDFAKFFAVGGEVHEAPNNVELYFLIA
jgi:hypothetical protein